MAGDAGPEVTAAAMRMHVPGPIASQWIGVAAPEGAYEQFQVALCRCSCGSLHAAVDEPGGFGSAAFWLGVKFAQLNRWTDLDGGAFDAPEDEAPG